MKTKKIVKPGNIHIHRFLSFCMMVGLMLTCISTFAQKDQPLNPAIKDALYYIDVEQPSKAIDVLEKLAAANSADASYQYYLGYAYFKTGNKPKAIAAFDKGIQVNPEEPLDYVGKGLISMSDKKPTEAKPMFDKALSMTKSKSVAVLKGVAEAYDLDSKFSVEAVALLNKAKGISDTDPDIHFLIGDTYLVQNPNGNVGHSISSYENVLLIKPTDPKLKSHMDAKSHYKVGMLYERVKNNDEAMASFLLSLKSDSGYTSSYGELGELYYLKKDADNAVKMYKKYLSLTEHPETANNQFKLAFFYFMDKDYKNANSIFEKVAYAPDVKPFTLRFYAKSLYESGDYEKAGEMNEKYFKAAKPEEIDANDHMYYGQILIKLKKDSLGFVELQKSIDMNGNQPGVLMTMATSAFKVKNYKQSIAAYKQLMKLHNPATAQDYYSIGSTYYRAAMYQEADSSFTKFTEMQPDIVLGWLWLARTKSQFDSGDDIKGLAKPYFEKVIEKGSSDKVKYKNELAEAYGYLGYYYYSKKDVANAKSNYKSVLELKPEDPQAKDALETLDKLGKAPAKPVKKATK